MAEQVRLIHILKHMYLTWPCESLKTSFYILYLIMLYERTLWDEFMLQMRNPKRSERLNELLKHIKLVHCI